MGEVAADRRERGGGVEAAWICFDDHGPSHSGEGGEGEAEGFDPLAWKEARNEAVSRVESELASRPEAGGGRKLVVADDNMHLRSMRRQVYLLARDHGADFAVLHIDAELPVALERNASRGPSALPDHVLADMSAKFEPPGAPGCPRWEAEKTLVLSSEQAGDAASVWRKIESRWSEAVSDYNSPLSQAARKTRGRLLNSESRLHQLDNRLRKEVSSAVRFWKSRDPGLGAESLSKRAAEASEARRDILGRFRRMHQWSAEEEEGLVEEFRAAIGLEGESNP